jgi:predicted nucleotidyltransferase
VDRQQLQALAGPIGRIARHYGAVRLRVFGSVARGEASPESDLDLLADFEPTRDLLDVAGLKLDLEALLGCKADVVEEASLSPYLRERVLKEAQPL